MEKVCGIYSLSWGVPEDKLVYVGKSVDIYHRFKSHVNSMLKGSHSNYLVQRIFNAFKSAPILTILEECEPEKLNNREVFWHIELNSVSEGLNIILPGEGGFGTSSSNSKYSRRSILKSFALLCKIPQISYTDISNRSGVSRSMLTMIRAGKAHIWLKYVYTNKYKIMESRSVVKVLPGTANSNSKYSRKTLLKCLSLLAKKPSMTQQAIADRLSIPRHVITSIRSGAHTWLQVEYPLEYNLMLSRNSVSKKVAGTSNPNSRYSRKTILKCLCLLTKNKTNREIADRLGMNVAAVHKVKKKLQHKWLGAEFPERYNLLNLIS